MRRTLVAIVGATATGKTAMGETYAERVRGVVVCADARQVFRELELGTGKPTAAERSLRPHALFDWLGLGERPTAGRWARAAAAVCEAAFGRGVIPVLVGGSGLYLVALQRGLHPEPPRDANLRAMLERECEAVGVEPMHARLAERDPETARRLAPRDRQRVLRALEVTTVSGHTLGWWRELPREAPLAADWCTYELTFSPAALAERIGERTRTMWAQGLLAETRALRDSGCEPALRQLAAIGYDEALELLAGTIPQSEAERRMNERTRQLAKRQRTWFRHQLPTTALDGSARSATAWAEHLAATTNA